MKAQSSLGRATSAIGATLMMQLWLALVAGAAAACIGPVLDMHGVATRDVRGALEVVALAPELVIGWLGVGALAVLVHLAAMPALQLAWLYALAHGEPAGTSLRFGLTHYGAALRHSFVVGVAVVLGGAVLGVLPLWVHGRMDSQPEEPSLLAIAASTLPLCAFLFSCSLWHDLGRAQLATHGSLTTRGLWGEWKRAFWPSNLAAFLLCLLAGAALLALPPFAYGARMDLLGLLVAQLLLLLRGFVRSLWLARATLLAERSGPR